MKLQPVALPPRPKGLRFDVKALADARFEVKADAATIEIFDNIGFEVTPTRIAAALRTIGPKPVTVQINSPGGDPFDGLAIYNLLRAHGQKITVEIIGIAASAASLIAMAGDEILIGRGGQLMIHRAAGVSIGDADTMRTMAEALDKIDGGMADLYATRTGIPREQIVAMMADETWMTAEEAIDLGFVDGRLDRDAAPAPKASAAPASKRELEEQFRRAGFSRAEASRMTGAAWAARNRGAEDPDVDLSQIAALLKERGAAISKR